MENNDKYKKLKTLIPGLDKLFYGGLEIPEDKATIIVIKGNEQTAKTLFGIQLLNNLGIQRNQSPSFYTTYETVAYLNDLLLDTIIAGGIRDLINKYVTTGSAQGIPAFSHTFFNTDSILFTGNNDNIAISKSELQENTDLLLCKEILHYNNRTNALHIKTLNKDDDAKNIVFPRKYNTINEYYDDKSRHEMLQIIENRLHPYSSNVKFKKIAIDDIVNYYFDRLIALDIDRRCNPQDVEKLIEDIKYEWKKSTVLILILDEDMDFPEYMADIIIHLQNTLDNNYMFQQLCIEKSNFQGIATGWHQYKKRDYGIEVFPSLHTYFQKRRYLQRAITYTHSNIVTDTFQQHLEKSKAHKGIIQYQGYECTDRYLDAMIPSEFMEYTSEEVLNEILLEEEDLSKPDNNHGFPSKSDILYGHRNYATAIIGEANTYKRFITFGSAFSSCVKYEHTLILLMNKEDTVVRRRLYCAACMQNGEKNSRCENCYKYMHFMNIAIGYISADELIYYLQQQIRTCFADGKKIKRIIVDDLQIIDFCFPMLKINNLFLSALMSVCRNENVALYILCDKEASLTTALRSMADNVVCTDRDNDGSLMLYVEKFAGYNMTPSRIYCCKISRPKYLFKCFETSTEETGNIYRFMLNTKILDDYPVQSMHEYWSKK